MNLCSTVKVESYFSFHDSAVINKITSRSSFVDGKDVSDISLFQIAYPILEMYSSWYMQKENHDIYLSKFHEFTLDPIKEANEIKKFFKWDFNTSNLSGYNLSTMSEEFKNELRIRERHLEIKLTSFQKEKIRKIYQNFPKVDFALIDEEA